MQLPQRSVKLVNARLGCHLDDGTTMPAILRVEGLGQNPDLRQFIQTEKKAGSPPGRISPHRIGRIHTVNQNVGHIRTDAIDCHLPRLTVRKKRRSTAGVRSDSRLQRNRAKKIAVVEGQFCQALLWKSSSDSRRRAVDPGNVREDRRLLRKVAYRELRIYPHFGSRIELNPFANLGLESCFLYTKRIVSGWQAGETVFAGRVSEGAPFQSSARADNRNADAGDNGPTRVGDGAGNSRKLGLRPRADGKERCQSCCQYARSIRCAFRAWRRPNIVVRDLGPHYDQLSFVFRHGSPRS